MLPLAIDLRGVAPSILPADNPALAAAVEKALGARQPMTDGARFDNRL